MIDPDPFSLSDREKRFIEAFLESSNASAAAVAAGYKPASARGNASKVRWRPRVAAAIAAAQKARVERFGVGSDHVMAALVAIAFADATELVQHRRVACRHCWGAGHLYQHTDPEQAQRRTRLGAKFEEQGGEGFDRWADPSPDCPECQGYGLGEVIVNDTRLLSNEGRALFAGVRKTVRGGIEVRMHDRVAALALLGKQLGMFKEELEPPIPQNRDDWEAVMPLLDSGRYPKLEAAWEEQMAFLRDPPRQAAAPDIAEPEPTLAQTACGLGGTGEGAPVEGAVSVIRCEPERSPDHRDRPRAPRAWLG